MPGKKQHEEMFFWFMGGGMCPLWPERQDSSCGSCPWQQEAASHMFGDQEAETGGLRVGG